MDVAAAAEIAEFLNKYNEHFTEMCSFLSEKQNKVLADDLVWLHDSLTEEQKLVMRGNSIECKRIEMMERLGLGEYVSSRLIDEAPEEYRGKLRLECVGIENSIDRVKKLNAEILEAVEKKMTAAESFLRERGMLSTDVYDEAGARVRLSNPDDDIIGSV
ncbi:MAG: flagellar protein FlgN [Oscillospiraceae bacterium]|jgi:hypothetical protein|nr:flagellar protein FlgN [Oscillospiraceae bacterium]